MNNTIYDPATQTLSYGNIHVAIKCYEHYYAVNGRFHKSADAAIADAHEVLRKICARTLELNGAAGDYTPVGGQLSLFSVEEVAEKLGLERYVTADGVAPGAKQHVQYVAK